MFGGTLCDVSGLLTKEDTHNAHYVLCNTPCRYSCKLPHVVTHLFAATVLLSQIDDT
jgi:hypothetical protein